MQRTVFTVMISLATHRSHDHSGSFKFQKITSATKALDHVGITYYKLECTQKGSSPQGHEESVSFYYLIGSKCPDKGRR